MKTKQLIISIAFLALGIMMISLNRDAHVPEGKHQQNLLIPPKQLRFFTLGYNETVSDSLWIRLLQDLDLCAPGKGSLVAKSRAEQEKLAAELARSGRKEARCEKGWSFHMLDTITELTPKFEAPYRYGAPSLSVVTDDREGAARIYDKGLEQYPNEKAILMGAAYHFLIEMNEPEKAAELLIRAGKAGAPEWVFSLAGRLYTEAGKAELAYVTLNAALNDLGGEDAEGTFAERLRERIKAAEDVIKSQNAKK